MENLIKELIQIGASNIFINFTAAIIIVYGIAGLFRKLSN